VERIRQAVKTRATVASASELRIELASLGDDSGLIGAALLA
jgi:predicted NBD/HSP70 family sugar kinase